MKIYKQIFLATSFLLFSLSCQESGSEKGITSTDYAIEKAKILKTLNNEIKAAFQRDYNGWKEYWVQEPPIDSEKLLSV